MPTLLSLPPELLLQIFSHTITEPDSPTLNRDLLRSQPPARNPSHDLNLMTWASNRHPILSTCRRLQTIGIRIFLNNLHLLCECDLSGHTPNDAHAVIQTLISIQKLDMLDALGSIGIVFEDYWLRTVIFGDLKNFEPPTGRLESDTVMKFIRDSCARASVATEMLRDLKREYGIRESQIRVEGRYGTLAYTDGNALPAIKKALRRTWKRDVVSVSIYPWDMRKSQEVFDEAMTLMRKELGDGTNVIREEIEGEKRKERANGLVTSPWENRYTEFLSWRQDAFEVWCERVRTWHLCLVGVVMDACAGKGGSKEHS